MMVRLMVMDPMVESQSVKKNTKKTQVTWLFPKKGENTPKMDGFIMDNPIKMDDLPPNKPF